MLFLHQPEPPSLRVVTSTEAQDILQLGCSLGLDQLGCGCSQPHYQEGVDPGVDSLNMYILINIAVLQDEAHEVLDISHRPPRHVCLVGVTLPRLSGSECICLPPGRHIPLFTAMSQTSTATTHECSNSAFAGDNPVSIIRLIFTIYKLSRSLSQLCD